MWARLRKQVDVELGMLAHSIEAFRPLLDTIAEGNEPSFMERSALATFLHSFYNGMENCFKRTARLIDGTIPRGPSSHAKILDRMVQPTAERPAVISQELRENLIDYMRFRHMFRHGYAVDLKWDRMATLVLRAEEVLGKFRQELDAFLSKGGGGQNDA